MDPQPDVVDNEFVSSTLQPGQHGSREISPTLQDEDNDTTVVQWIFFLLGCAVLLPWNAIIVAIPFFQSRLEDSPLRAVFASYLVAAIQLCRFPTLIHATLSVKKSSKTTRIRVSGISLVLLLALLFAITFIKVSPQAFFGFVIVNATLQSMVNSYFQTSIVAIASWFGPQAIRSMFSGQAGIAVVISSVQLISVLVSLNKQEIPYPSNPELSKAVDGRTSVDRSAGLFFLIMTTGMVTAIISHTYLVQIPLYQRISKVFDRRTPPLLSEETPLLVEGAPTTESIQINEQEKSTKRIIRIVRVNWTWNLAIFLNFFITLAVFPAITSAILSIHPPLSSRLSHPLVFNAIHFLLFNLGDWTGRWICNFEALQVWSGSYLLLLSIMRTGFIPLFLICNIQDTISNTPLLINTDLGFFTIIALFGITNGYLGSLCMMFAPSLEHNTTLERDDVDVAAVVASFCLAGGLTGGSIANFGIRSLMCHCNPFLS
ncbi:hypothetical protein CPB86DRAFT_727955 [Serendipita vermifera]|nr:hypothetical protein CPB86DRAFT_727955 [Serendipita vermifera]